MKPFDVQELEDGGGWSVARGGVIVIVRRVIRLDRHRVEKKRCPFGDDPYKTVIDRVPVIRPVTAGLSGAQSALLLDFLTLQQQLGSLLIRAELADAARRKRANEKARQRRLDKVEVERIARLNAEPEPMTRDAQLKQSCYGRVPCGS